jgi:integrase
MARRRGNGEGSISRRKDGRWEARYSVQTTKGPRRKTIYGKTRGEVGEKLARVERWLDSSVKGSVKPVTAEGYERLIRCHIAPALGRHKLKTLSPGHFQMFYQERLGAGISPSIRHTCATLLLSRGVHPKLVQELLGHATKAMTLDRYSHVLPGMGDQTAAAMEAALF